MRLSNLIVELTSACNLDCRYCYNVWKAPGGRRPAPSRYPQVVKALKRIFRMARVDHVTLSGGEPFLMERLYEILLLCRLSGKGVSLITNGTQASAEQLRRARDAGAQLFELPLHAPTAAAHDRMTGKDGCWERSRASMQALLDMGAKVAAVVVITQVNAHLVGQTLSHLAELGIDRVMLNRFNIGGRGIAEAGWLLPSQAQLVEAFGQADQVAAARGLRVASGVCTPLCLVDTAAFPHIAFSTCHPQVEKRPLTLDPLGNLRYCNHSPVDLGNIFTQRLEEIVAGAAMQQWQQAVPEPCQGCGRFGQCLGGCRAAAEQLGLSPAHADPVLELCRVQPPHASVRPRQRDSVLAPSAPLN